MAGRIAKGLTQAILRAIENTAPEVAPRVVRKLPVGSFVKHPEPTKVHPDLLNPGLTLNSSNPVHRMVHGTNSRVPFSQPLGDLSDTGLSLTRQPDVASLHALGRATRDTDLMHQFRQGTLPPGTSLAGPRMYPMLVDPGKTFGGIPLDTTYYRDPLLLNMRLQTTPGFNPDYPDMDKVMSGLGQREPFNRVLQDLGYDSASFPHVNPYHPSLTGHAKNRATGQTELNPDPEKNHALLLFDDSRAVPEFSEVGQQIKKARGVLDLAPHYDADPEVASTALGGFGGMAGGPEAFMDEAFDAGKVELEDYIVKVQDDLLERINDLKSDPLVGPHEERQFDEWVNEQWDTINYVANLLGVK